MPVSTAFWAIFAGLVSHQVFKRHEPSLDVAGAIFVVGNAAVWLYLSSTGLSGYLLLQTWAQISISYLVALLCSILTYRAFLHPLRAFPGPFAARLSKFWAVSLTLEGKNHVRFADLHRKYGDFARIGPNELMIVNVEAIRAVYAPGSPWTRSEWYKAVPKPPHSESVMSLRTHAQHSQRRRIWDRGLRPEAVKEYLPMIDERVEQLGNRLASESATCSVDLSKWFSYFSFDCMGSLAFNVGFEMMQQGDVDGHWQTINEGVRLSAIFINVPWTTELLNFIAAACPWIPLVASKARLEAVAARQIDDRRKDETKGRDLSYWLLGEDSGQCQLSEPDLIADSLLVIVAGSDTVSSTLCFLFYHLIMDESIMARLRLEIDGLYESHGADAGGLAEQYAPYLNSCLSETLRLYPPVPNGHARVCPKGGSVVAGRFIPEGTTVFIPAYALQRDIRYWAPDPEVFRPDRWLIGGKFSSKNEAFVPFSYGPYTCAGKGLAWQEMRLATASLVHRFDMNFAEGFNAEAFLDQITAEFLLTKPPLDVTLRERRKGGDHHS